MIIQFNPEYRKYWKKWAKFKPSTSTFNLFLMKLESDHVYKRNVDAYIEMSRTLSQRQLMLERMSNYG